MKRLSGSEAISAGFRLIGRQPGVVLVWSLIYLAVFIVPVLLSYASIWPEVVGVYGSMVREAAAGDTGFRAMEEVNRLRLHLLPYQLLQLPLGMIGTPVLFGAIYRSVLEPRNSAFAYLRLGAQELWMLFVGVVLFLLALTALAAAGLVIVLAALALGAGRDPMTPWAGGVAAVLSLAALGGFTWAGLRLSLALPMTFSERKFALFAAWPLTRGRVWKLLGVSLALGLIVVIIELLLMSLVAGAGLAVYLANQDYWLGLARDPRTDWFAHLAPVVAVWSVVAAVLSVGVRVIVIAPFADIYAQLRPASDLGPEDAAV